MMKLVAAGVGAIVVMLLLFPTYPVISESARCKPTA
jgi:hypothetical protein